MGDEVAVAHPSATVVLTRDGGAGLEVLLVRRNTDLAFHGGSWVFPGGRIDDGDQRSTDVDTLGAARRAAAREAEEEAGLAVTPEDLVVISRWTTPEFMPKRFTTWFFAGVARPGEVTVDGGEIHDHVWITPAAALASQRDGERELPPPTYVTLLKLGAFSDSAEFRRALADWPVEEFTPRITKVPGGAVCLYHGDVAYEEERAIDRPGPRHRLVMLDRDWRYERS